jgi:hypothetical protein
VGSINSSTWTLLPTTWVCSANPAAREHAEHRAVVGRSVGDESGDATLPGDSRQMFEQDGADAPTLILVRDDERRFGAVGACLALVGGETEEEPIAQLRH